MLNKKYIILMNMLFAIVGVVLEHLGVTDVTGLFLKTSKSPSPGKSFQKAKRPEKSRIDLQNQEFIKDV